jgi:hypothetical protein
VVASFSFGLPSHTRPRSQETFRYASADRRRIREDLLVNWHDADTSELFETIRRQSPPAEAEQLVWALERVIGGAKVDPALLDHLAVAAICLLAYRDEETPRTIIERLFRRAVDDDRWRDDYASLLTAR